MAGKTCTTSFPQRPACKRSHMSCRQAETSEALSSHEELWVQRAICPLWVLLRELFENVWGWGFPLQATAPRRQAAPCTCEEEDRDPSRASTSSPHGLVAGLGNPRMPPLLYQAPSFPLVLKGISSLQHSLSTSSKESGVPHTRLALLCRPGVLL